MKEQVHTYTVSFISIGSGTDREARKRYDRFILDCEEANNTKLTYQKVNWGREGEMDYCFEIGALIPSIQEKFIAESKDILKESQLIRYVENKPCREPRK